MKRLFKILAALVLGIVPEHSALAVEASRPNIVSIMADDMGRSDIGCSGSEIPKKIPFSKGKDPKHPDHALLEIRGWTVHLNKKLWKKNRKATAEMLKLLDAQLKRVVDAVPPKALAHLRTIPIWVNPKYKGIIPRGEYHPSAKWLKEHGRNPEMAKSVEITNVSIFPRENRRMPLMLLHEFAHAYHDQVLGFDNPEIKAAYEKARKSGRYDKVKRTDGKNISMGRAYAMTNDKEYFAELSEALFGKNDFEPFDREELKKFDPAGFAVVAKMWGLDVGKPKK